MAEPSLPGSSAHSMTSMLNQAISAHQAGNLAEADRLYRGLLARDGRQFDALHMLGVLEAQRGNFDAAERMLRKALAVDPKFPPCIHNYGNVLAKLNRFEEAVTTYNRALAQAPRHAPLHSDRGNALSQLNRLAEALASYDQALAVQPNYAEAHYNRGCVLLKLDRYDEALAGHDRALAINPNHADAHHARAQALHKLGRFADALASCDKALAINPGKAEAHCDRAAVLHALHRFDEAIAHCQRALALNSALASAHNIIGNCLNALDRQDEAIAAYDRALALDPNLAECQTSKGLCLLSLGRLAEGWPLFDQRWRMKRFPARPYPQPWWDGRPVDGVLVAWGEQGLGDQILYSSMVPELAGRARSVVVEVEPRLMPLFARSFPGMQVVAERPFPQLYAGPVSMHAPFGNLGRYLRPDRQAFPRRERGHLAADPAQTRALRRRLAGEGRKVIGLSWISVNREMGRSKSVQLREFEPLLRLPDCRFIDLQYGDTLGERELVERELNCRLERLADIDNTKDIDGLAALISACDAVVSVSNTTAHLAGALGTPTWILVPFGQARLWYWFKDGADSPWYSQVHLRRQRVGEPSARLLEAVAKEIADFTAGK